MEKRNFIAIGVVLLVIILMVGGTFNSLKKSGDKDILLPVSMEVENKSFSGVVLKTNLGDIEIKFLADEAPKTVNNFIKLTEESFFEGIKFHRVIKGFMIQSGDPLTKDDSASAMWGTGGPGYTFEDEIHSKNNNAVGTIAMANSGPNTNGSQFFINVADNNFLDTKHTVFGQIINGLDIVMKISEVPTKEGDVPVDPVIIERIELK
jgi:peptidylprolyl isomerase